MIDELSPLDRDALQRCIDLTLSETDQARVDQVNTMLAERDWFEVARFCAYHRQNEALHLKPWESPPATAEVGRGHHKAIGLRDKMLAAGLSMYEPDPAAALRAASRGGGRT